MRFESVDTSGVVPGEYTLTLDGADDDATASVIVEETTPTTPDTPTPTVDPNDATSTQSPASATATSPATVTSPATATTSATVTSPTVTTRPETASDDGPGFGLAVAVLALLAVVFVLAGRRKR